MTTFIPPFCRNPGCTYHHPSPGSPYTSFERWGSYSTRAFGRVPRFRCTSCGTTFSRQTFRLDYWLKRVYDYNDLTERLASCSSIRAIGRAYHVAGKSIQNRIGRAARQVIAFEAKLSCCRRPKEDLVADGFESFCVSQYYPNNIHLLVGASSQFVYATDHVTIRRKGTMTRQQKKKREQLEQRFRADPQGLCHSFSRILEASFSILADVARPSLRLWTDQKREYRSSLRQSDCATGLLESGRLVHRTVSSRALRSRWNPLFPVNYLDRELRKDLHEHTRETVCFGRNVNAQMERFHLYLYYHNYCKAHRSRGAFQSNALLAGYDPQFIAVEMKKLWEWRAWHTQIELDVSYEETWMRLRRTPLKQGKDYLPKHVVA